MQGTTFSPRVPRDPLLPAPPAAMLRHFASVALSFRFVVIPPSHLRFSPILLAVSLTPPFHRLPRRHYRGPRALHRFILAPSNHRETRRTTVKAALPPYPRQRPPMLRLPFSGPPSSRCLFPRTFSGMDTCLLISTAMDRMLIAPASVSLATKIFMNRGTRLTRRGSAL